MPSDAPCSIFSLRCTSSFPRAICVKNAVDFLVCTITWNCVGYPFAFGAKGAFGDFVGVGKWFGTDIESTSGEWYHADAMVAVCASYFHSGLQGHSLLPVDILCIHLHHRLRLCASVVSCVLTRVLASSGSGAERCSFKGYIINTSAVPLALTTPRTDMALVWS